MAFERAASGTRFGVRVAKLTGAGFALLLGITIISHLADPATRLATIFALVAGSGFIVLFIDTVKVMWANVTGQG